LRAETHILNFYERIAYVGPRRLIAFIFAGIVRDYEPPIIIANAGSSHRPIACRSPV
jgi:hypothetical protein